MKDNHPICMKQKADCFANVSGQCRILINADFKERDCPFYKTQEQCTEENQQRIARLEDQGLLHLLEKYGGRPC